MHNNQMKKKKKPKRVWCSTKVKYAKLGYVMVWLPTPTNAYLFNCDDS